MKWIPLRRTLKIKDDWGEIKVPVNATKKDWEDYPSGAKRHSERNNPQFVAGLIQRLSNIGDRVHDPQCGIGTVIYEARKFARIPTGWDIREEWREVIGTDPLWSSVWFPLVFNPTPDTIDLIVTSPSYGNMSHSLGKREKQRKMRESLNSTQGTEMHKTNDLDSQDLSQCKSLEEWEMKWSWMLDRMYRMLKPGGKLVIIVKEKVQNQKPQGILEAVRNTCARAGFTYLGYHWRKLLPSGIRRAQGKKYYEDTGKNPVYPDREYGMIFRKEP